jgi:hypothetical protein
VNPPFLSLFFPKKLPLSNRMLKNAHLLRSPRPSSLQRTYKYASLLRISGALHLGIFEHPGKNYFFSSLLTHLQFDPPSAALSHA